MKTCVVITGQMNSGKNVFAEYLIKKLNEKEENNWKLASFAGAVKKCFCDYFNVTLDFIEEWKRKPEIPEGMLMPVRQGLQFIGDGFRKIKSDIWIETCFNFNEMPFVAVDGRYFNEAKATKERGGINILLWRKGYENNDPNPSESEIMPLVRYCVDNNISGIINHSPFDPCGLEFYDLFICNDGNLEDLFEKIDKVVIPYIDPRYS